MLALGRVRTSAHTQDELHADADLDARLAAVQCDEDLVEFPGFATPSPHEQEETKKQKQRMVLRYVEACVTQSGVTLSHQLTSVRFTYRDVHVAPLSSLPSPLSPFKIITQPRRRL